MMPRVFLVMIGVICVSTSVGCTSLLFHWGEYEDSLLLRYEDASEEGQLEAFALLQETIEEAESKQGRLAPGVYADYGYLLFKRGNAKEAVVYFQKEAVLYPESKYFMDSLISRVQGKAGT